MCMPAKKSVVIGGGKQEKMNKVKGKRKRSLRIVQRIEVAFEVRRKQL